MRAEPTFFEPGGMAMKSIARQDQETANRHKKISMCYEIGDFFFGIIPILKEKRP